MEGYRNKLCPVGTFDARAETPHPAAHGRHALPSEREKIIARSGALKIRFSLSRGERVDRAARFHQRARDG